MVNELQNIRSRYMFSNEILTGISILSVLNYTDMYKLEVSKCLLIEPLLNHKSLRNALKRKNYIARSVEELIFKEIDAFTNFNDRFKEALPLSINAIMLMLKLKLLTVDSNELLFVERDFFHQKFETPISDRILASEKIARILQSEDSSNLYLNLRVEL